MKLLDKNEKNAYIDDIEPDEDMREYLKRDEYATLDNGAIIRFYRPTIKSTLWYRDDIEIDSDTEEKRHDLFIDYNKTMNLDSDYTCCEQWRNKEIGAIRRPYAVIRRKEDGTTTASPVFMRQQGAYRFDDGGEERYYLSDKEIREYEAIAGKLVKAYEKRLNTYWKRYGDKVRIDSYWADR